MFNLMMEMAEQRFEDLETKLFKWETVAGSSDYTIDYYTSRNVGNFVVGSLEQDITITLPTEGRVHDKPSPGEYTPILEAHPETGELYVHSGPTSQVDGLFQKVAPEDWEPTMERCSLDGETVKVKLNETNGFQVKVTANCMVDGASEYVLPVAYGSVEFVFTNGAWQIR